MVGGGGGGVKREVFLFCFKLPNIVGRVIPDFFPRFPIVNICWLLCPCEFMKQFGHLFPYRSLAQPSLLSFGRVIDSSPFKRTTLIFNGSPFKKSLLYNQIQL